jgi:5-methylcytosine-specific restriction endonuclease McrA
VCVDPFGLHAQRGEVVPSIDVDHILPKSDGGLDREDNLRGLCHSCHSRVTVSQ